MSTELQPGAHVGRYEILKRIGAGGMAEVYLARPRAFPDERVAIKRLLPSYANEPRFIEMFVAEARLAATLKHHNIAAVHDVFVDRGACFFAMELIDGLDVTKLLAAAILRDKPMPLAIAISIMYGVTCALAYVHDPNGPHARLNLVHRDISPSNILVSFAGAIKLVDFGIARIETDTPRRTRSGHIKGKIPYMSPEQCRARPLDGRSDLFSLGVVLYELTTNARPFDRTSDFDTLEAIVRGEMTAPSRLAANYPPDLEDIVLRLLATKLSDRYPSANALLMDLDRIVAAQSLDLSEATLAKHIAALLGIQSPPVVPAAKPDRFKTEVVRRDPAEQLATSPGFAPLELAGAPARSPAAREPSDRVIARANQILESVAAGTTDARDLGADAVAQLIGRAMRSHAKGDLDSAVISLELALSAARAGDGVDEVLASHESLFSAVYTEYLGDQTRMAAVSQHVEELVGVAIDQRAVFLMTRIDGNVTAAELIATCGLPPREARRHLCQLIMREIVVLV